MASAVKTRKMTAGKKKGGEPDRNSPRMLNYTLTKSAGSNIPTESNKSNLKAMPTPTRSHSGKNKGKQRNEQVCDMKAESASDSDVESIVGSDGQADTTETSIPFGTLGELELVCHNDIDPREVSLTEDSIPMILLSFLTKIEKLEGKQSELEVENSGLKGSLDFAYAKIDDLEKREKEQNDRVQKNEKKVDTVSSENSKLKLESERNKERNIKSESYSRRSNLRFEGIPVLPEETNIQCRNRIYEILNSNLGIEDADQRIVIEKCHRDRKFPRQEPPSVLVRFLSLCDRQEIWENRNKLNRDRSNKLFINEDFPQQVERKRAFLRPYLKAAYASQRRATLRGDTLIVESEKYTVDTLHLLPDDLKPEKVAIKTKGEISAFFRADAFLSNFHPATFTLENTQYSSVEQYYMSQKAEKFGDTDTRNNIMASNDPGEINYLARQISNFSQRVWNEVAVKVMAEGVLAKFTQNEKLKQLLLDTGSNTLVEASARDKYWGAGIHINDDKIFDKKNWSGANHLGTILMECRSSFRV